MQIINVRSTVCFYFASVRSPGVRGLQYSRPVLIVNLLETHATRIKFKEYLRMNFNRQDSLKMTDVLNDPQFVAFLRKWEMERQPSEVRALFGCKITPHFYDFVDSCLISTNFVFLFSSFMISVTFRVLSVTQHRQRISSNVADRRVRWCHPQKLGWRRGQRRLAEPDLGGLRSATVPHRANREEAASAALDFATVSRHKIGICGDSVTT